MNLMTTNAEQHAMQAEGLPAFSGIKLQHVRNAIAQLLSLVGREGFFNEYTIHDIRHIDAMLRSLDWIVPADSLRAMSPADWLAVVLAIYFHDLGLLITHHEYANRNSTSYRSYAETHLFTGPRGTDYQARVRELSPDEADRFLYQEFVRAHHATRIRHWIQGTTSTELGASQNILKELDSLLAHLPPQFRRDLALICESHHLDDLSDSAKYRVEQPYGNSADETVNLLYSAALLRTTDLLHITSDRTPSVTFAAINPTDPRSQIEWAKQLAVKRIWPKPSLDRDGNVDPNASTDTTQVAAYFTNAEGFFGLSSYLTYVEAQLEQTHQAVKASQVKHRVPHAFPWRRIDSTQIETEGFLRSEFRFTLDQARILDLLTGHTLYNDTSVVLRELVQNSIDAIRLQRRIDGTEAGGAVNIHWNSETRLLTVSDSGTGMTQDVIERHFLTVGSSYYQDDAFKRAYPGFSPISRFGIGVLSAFMIADAVDITTCHPTDPDARSMSLRTVHGSYLVRLIAKTDPQVKDIYPHGTRIALRVRPSADLEDVAKIVARWVLFPSCAVTVSENREAQKTIGYASPAEALTGYLKSVGHNVCSDGELPVEGRTHRVSQVSKDGVTVAYALRWSEYFHEWEFENFVEDEADDSNDDDDEKTERASVTSREIGTCIEGIRVLFDTPGFVGRGIAAIANATGAKIPKTNVARSGLESSRELTDMLRSVYEAYASHLTKEITAMRERGVSLSWAVDEAEFLLLPFGSETARPQSRSLLTEALRDVPNVLVEADGQRKAVTIREMSSYPYVWTVDSVLVQSAESILREHSGSGSLASVAKALGEIGAPFPEPLWCGRRKSSSLVSNELRSQKEIEQVSIDFARRRMDLRWAPVSDPRRWLSVNDELLKTRRWQLRTNVLLVETGVRIEADEQWHGAKTAWGVLLWGHQRVREILHEALRTISSNNSERDASNAMTRLSLLSQRLIGRPAKAFDLTDRLYRMTVEREIGHGILTQRDLDEIEELASGVEIFDLDVWLRGRGYFGNQYWDYTY